jgi:tetratricopeptide (TPR) repeat protein
MGRQANCLSLFRTAARSFGGALVILGLLPACTSSRQVVRKRGDVVNIERRIDPLAYAWFARGLHHERHGQLRTAASDYRHVLQNDPKSGAAWAALGRVLCRDENEAALALFEEGLRKAERKAPVFTERGLCLLRSRSKATLFHRTALSDAKAALALEPRYERANLLLASCYHALDEPERAKTVLRAFRLFTGWSAPANEAIAPDEAVDQALLESDLKRAQSLALTHFTQGELAVRAAAWGKLALAREQATFVLKADPHDGDAWVALVVTGEAPLSRPTAGLRELSTLSVVVFGRHMRRVLGEKAAEHFLDEHKAQIRASRDPLVRHLLNETPRWAAAHRN